MRLLHTMLRVRDLDASIRFYCDHFGMKLIRRNKGPVAAAAIIVVLLVGGVTGTTQGMISAIRANRALDISLQEELEQRKRERRSLARPGGGHSQHVTPLEKRGNGCTLDWRGFFIAKRRQSLEQLRPEAEFGEGAVRGRR